MCRHLEIAESTWNRWLAQYGAMNANDPERLEEFEVENARVKNSRRGRTRQVDAQGDRRVHPRSPRHRGRSTPTLSSPSSTASLSSAAARRGFVRFCNGPEFIAMAVADWCRFNTCESVFIDPGSPWQNAWIESFNGGLRDEFLNGRHFDSILEACVQIEDWRIDYRKNRPHSARGDLSPTEFAVTWTINQPQAA